MEPKAQLSTETPPAQFSGRLGIQQRVLPAYRAPFFDSLAAACEGGLSVFAGQPLPGESIATTGHLKVAHYHAAHNLHFFPMGSPLYQCWQAGLVKWLEAWQPDVLIVEANPRYANTPQAIRWMHTRGRLVVGWGLGAPPIAGWFARWRLRSRRRLIHSLDGLIAYSRKGAEEYRLLGFPAERIFVAPNAAAPRPGAPSPHRTAARTDRPLVLFVGRLQARKRIDHLLRACAALPLSLQPRLCIVGDGPARTELQELAERIYPRAEFTGALHGPELERRFLDADLFVLPGTGGLAVQQAMAHGLPVIVAEGDGTQDDLVWTLADPQGQGKDTLQDHERRENGWRIPPGDLPALTQTLQAALSDPERLQRMGEESYRIVAEEANLEAMAAAFLGALNVIRETG